MTEKTDPSKIILQAFPGITPAEVTELLNSSQMVQYPAGIVLCHENALEDIFYLILDGRVEVTKVINNDQVRLLKMLSEGDFFGEMAIIHNAPRAATVKTLTPLSVLEINKEAFDRVLHNSSSVSLAMVREISQRLRENDTMAIDDLRDRATELADAYQKLAEQDVARRNFLTNISHQLRTPLMAAGGYLQMLQNGSIPPSAASAALETVSRNVQKITTLVNDLLSIQEMELILGQFTPLDILDMVDHIAREHEPKARANGVRISILPAPSLPPVSGDAQSLGRAISALVDNAIKFSPNGGDVNIHMHNEDGQVIIAVSDHGIGIGPEVMPHIFDRFYHLDKSGDQLFDGLGIGLAIARQVIEQHKGRLDVKSKPGEGSTFTVRVNAWKNGTPLRDTVQ